MKILILNGSPRPQGNTAAMVAAYAEGAREAGHEVNIIDVCKLKIGGCLACEYCHTKGGGKCVQKDGMQEVYPLLEEAEMIVLASPVYYHSFTSRHFMRLLKHLPDGGRRLSPKCTSARCTAAVNMAGRRTWTKSKSRLPGILKPSARTTPTSGSCTASIPTRTWTKPWPQGGVGIHEVPESRGQDPAPGIFLP